MPDIKRAVDMRQAKAVKTAEFQEKQRKELHQKHLKAQESKLVAKLERIKTWPEKDREAATARTEDTLSQIRERMSHVDK